MTTISQDVVRVVIPRILRQNASRTHLPTILPLTFPSPLHTLNTLTVIHLIYAILSHPRHSEYFAETNSNPADAALTAVLGLYLSSSEDWSVTNLLSAAAWKRGKLDENLITEVFRIETTREKEHETMKGIRVGGRWDPGVKLVKELKGWFGTSGGELRCVGEWVSRVIEDSWKGGHNVAAFVRNCCDCSSATSTVLRDIYETPTEGVLPFAPLRLIYDLSVRQATSHDLNVRLPEPSQLENISPLPLSIPAALSVGIISLSEQPDLSAAVNAYRTSEGVQRVEISLLDYAEISQKTVEACRMIRSIAGDEGPSYLDIHLHFKQQDESARKDGRRLQIIVRS